MNNWCLRYAKSCFRSQFFLISPTYTKKIKITHRMQEVSFPWRLIVRMCFLCIHIKFSISHKKKFTFILHKYQVECYMKLSMLFEVGCLIQYFKWQRKLRKGKQVKRYIFSARPPQCIYYIIKYLNNQKRALMFYKEDFC